MIEIIATFLFSQAALAFSCPDVQLDQLKEFKANPTPSGCYILQLTKATGAQKTLKGQILSLKHPQCVGLASSSDCFAKVLRLNPPKTSAEIAQWTVTGLAAANADREKKKAPQDLASLKVVDNALLSLENSNFSNFAVMSYRPSSAAEKVEVDELIKIEKQAHVDAKKKLLKICSEKLTAVYQQNNQSRIPSAEKTRQTQYYNELVKRHSKLGSTP